jgi:hypothetical protein
MIMRRVYTKQHRFYCGIDLHARLLAICIIDHQTNEVVLRRQIPADRQLRRQDARPGQPARFDRPAGGTAEFLGRGRRAGLYVLGAASRQPQNRTSRRPKSTVAARLTNARYARYLLTEVKKVEENGIALIDY